MHGEQLFIVLLCARREYVLQENSDNPEASMESFDVIYYAALQVVIVSSANGVSEIGSAVLRAWKLKYIAVVAIDVSDDGRRIFRVVLLLHRLHHRPQLLADQPVRRGHHEHVLSHPLEHEEERIWCRPVRTVPYIPKSLASKLVFP